ncbi:MULTISPECIES: LacI family DNA-binding transcriptional regulator [Arthrobacter]|uniref:LacI family DNA-binding transcriptional regulator n=1 Tax=Arthrobacter TaxID=1663 RepID=UPI001C627400|nr:MULTISPECIES: LacI family DNA-binding transcriptional regulator [Arthrobacter]QYF89181.1 LacI family transcriptional regulator [Arthrobacter sp. PAMC25284]
MALQAGVSKSLVSLVLNDSPLVRPDKREAVLTAIEALDYRPNTAARALVQVRTRAVGVILDDLRNPWFLESLRGVNEVLAENGLHMLLGEQRLGKAGGQSIVSTFLDRNVDGLILAGSMPQTADLEDAARKVPTVVLSSRNFSLPGVDVVANDDEAGGRMAVEHLIALGHRRIAHVAGDSGRVARLREEGYRSTMRAHGLRPAVTRSGNTEEQGHASGMRLLRQADRPTAVFAVNDLAAVGVLDAAFELGLSIPGQLSVVGYDNSFLAGIGHINLTSVDAAGFGTGVAAGEALVRRIASPEAPGTETLLAPELVVRRSSAAPEDPEPAGASAR